MDVDLDWCLICSQRTQSGLYCSEECRQQDCSIEPGLDHSDPAYLAALDMTINPISDAPFAGQNYPFFMPLTPPGDVTLPAYSIPYRARAPSTSSTTSTSSNLSSCPILSFSRRSSAAGTLPQLPAPQSQLMGNTAGVRYGGDLFGQPTILSKPVASGGKRRSLVYSYNEIVANILSSF